MCLHAKTSRARGRNVCVRRYYGKVSPLVCLSCDCRSHQLKKIRIHWSLVYLRSVVLTLLGGMLILTVLGASTFWIGQSFTSISLLFFSFSFCVTQGLSWALTAYITWANCSSLSQLLQGAYRSCAGLCVCACLFSPSWGMSDFEWPIIKTLLEYWSFPNLNGCRRQFDKY